MTNSLRDTSPLERLKRLDSEAEEKGEISETPVQVTDKADRSPGEERESNVVRLHPILNTHDPHLASVGWHPEERCEKTIWRHPDTGFYYSEEMARCISEEGRANAG